MPQTEEAFLVARTAHNVWCSIFGKIIEVLKIIISFDCQSLLWLAGCFAISLACLLDSLVAIADWDIAHCLF